MLLARTRGPPSPRRGWKGVRFTPVEATSNVMSMSETRRSRGNPIVPASTSGCPPQNSPASVLADLPRVLGIWRKSYKASARCTSMGDEATCTSENCKELRMSISSVYTSPIVFVRGKGLLINRDRSRSEHLSAMSTVECVYGVDISHNDCSHPNLTATTLRDGFEAHVLRRSCETQLLMSSGSTTSQVSSCSSQLRGTQRPIT